MSTDLVIKDETQFLNHLKKLSRIFEICDKLSKNKRKLLQTSRSKLNSLTKLLNNKSGLINFPKKLIQMGRLTEEKSIINGYVEFVLKRLQRFNDLLNKQYRILNMELQVFESDEKTLESIQNHKILSGANLNLLEIINTLILKQRDNLISLLQNYNKYKDGIKSQLVLSEQISTDIAPNIRKINSIIDKTNDCSEFITAELIISKSMKTLFYNLIQETKESIKENERLAEIGEGNIDFGTISEKSLSLKQQEVSNIRQSQRYFEKSKDMMNRIKEDIGIHWFFQNDYEKFYSRVVRLQKFLKLEDENLLIDHFEELRTHFRQMKISLLEILDIYVKEYNKIEEIPDSDNKVQLLQVFSELKMSLNGLMSWNNSGLIQTERILKMRSIPKLIKKEDQIIELKNSLIIIINHITDFLFETGKKVLGLVELEKEIEGSSKDKMITPVSKIPIVGKLKERGWPFSEIQTVVVELGGVMIDTKKGDHPIKIRFKGKRQIPLAKSTPADALISEVADASGKDRDTIENSFNQGKLVTV